MAKGDEKLARLEESMEVAAARNEYCRELANAYKVLRKYHAGCIFCGSFEQLTAAPDGRRVCRSCALKLIERR